MNVEAAEKYIIDKLSSELSATLFYHGLHHVIDVTTTAASLAGQEGIVEKESLSLLKTAALYHDCGFLNTYANHEEEGCKIVKSVLPGFDFTDHEIEIVCGMIMATKIPQNPQTHLEEILCDADLDYLGRDDFEPIANTLFEELKARNMVSDLKTWDGIQCKFIGAHKYWTHSARQTREDAKQKHLASLSLSRC